MPKVRVVTLLVGLGVSLATAVLMVATEPHMAIGWDEGYTLGREARLQDWFRGLRDPLRFAAQWRPLPPDREMVQEADKTPAPRSNQLNSRSKLLFDHQVLEWFWPFARRASRPSTFLCAARPGRGPLGPILARLGTGPAGSDPALQPHGRRDLLLHRFTLGRLGSGIAAGSWVLQPQLFGHGHYAAYDAVLTASGSSRSSHLLRPSYPRRTTACRGNPCDGAGF